ncbi:MAG: DUF3419 family protein [Bdellovibrionales bacterium]|nr:DUF3419 family protein [Bdellovibrionales bacterium]
MEPATYFSDLNYTLSNEDTRIEYDLLPENSGRVFSIAGSGARCLPLLAKNPAQLDVVDMSESQLFLFELRWRGAQALTYEEWLYFMGYRGGVQGWTEQADSRFILFQRLALTPEARDYWLARRSGWENQGFIRLGRWESHFQKLGRIFRDFLQCDFSPIFRAQSLAEQMELYKKHWPHKRFNAFLKVAASEYVFNKFLYKGHFSGSEGRRSESELPSVFLQKEFFRLFQTQLVRKNYFMQILFLGEIRYEEGLPWEAHRMIFERVAQSRTEVTMKVGNLLEELPKQAYDFVSLSVTISYLSESDAESLLQKLHPGAGTSLVAIRSFLRSPQKMNTEGWVECLDRNHWATQIDGTGVYRFHIYRKLQ